MGQVGVHGIVIKFSDDRGAGFSATFLPEVAAEQGVQAGIPRWNQCLCRFLTYKLDPVCYSCRTALKVLPAVMRSALTRL